MRKYLALISWTILILPIICFYLPTKHVIGEYHVEISLVSCFGTSIVFVKFVNQIILEIGLIVVLDNMCVACGS